MALRLRHLPSRRLIIAIIIIVLVVWLIIRHRRVTAAEASVDPIPRDSVATMITRDADIIHTDSGYPRYHATASIYMSFDNAPEPFWLFPEGADIEQFDNARNVVATLSCDSAVYSQYRQLWECIGNVRLNNVNGDRFATNLLFYDVRSERIYSDSFIHIERSDRIIEGYGFNSNSAITDYVVHRPTMILPVSDFNMASTDTATVATSNTSATTPSTSQRQRPTPTGVHQPLPTSAPLQLRPDSQQSAINSNP